jgi:hypothetical protein
MSYSPTVPGRMNAIKPLRGFAFAVLTASPTSVDEAVAEAAVLAAGLLRLHVDLSPVGTSQDAELARVPGRLAENLGSVALAVCRWRHVHVVPPQGRIGGHRDTAKGALDGRGPGSYARDERPASAAARRTRAAADSSGIIPAVDCMAGFQGTGLKR